MKVQPHSSEQGGFNYVTAIILLILAAIGLVCIYVIPKYFADFSLKQDMWALMVRSSELTDQAIEQKTVEAAKTRDIPLPPTQIQCTRSNESITCHYEYDWPLGIPGLDWSLKFSETKSREVARIKQI